MPTKLDDISEAIGALRAEVRNLGQKIDRGEAVTAEAGRRADEHRAAIHRRVDDLVADVGTLQTELATMRSDVIDAKTVTDEVKLWKQRGIGALFVSGIAGSAVGAAGVGAVIYWWDALMRLLRAA